MYFPCSITEEDQHMNIWAFDLADTSQKPALQVVPQCKSTNTPEIVFSSILRDTGASDTSG